MRAGQRRVVGGPLRGHHRRARRLFQSGQTLSGRPGHFGPARHHRPGQQLRPSQQEPRGSALRTCQHRAKRRGRGGHRARRGGLAGHLAGRAAAAAGRHCRPAGTRRLARPRLVSLQLVFVGASLLANGAGQRASAHAIHRRQAGSYRGTSACLCRSLPASDSCRATGITSRQPSLAGQLLQGSSPLYFVGACLQAIRAGQRASPHTIHRRQASSYRRAAACLCRSQPAGEWCQATGITSHHPSLAGQLLQERCCGLHALKSTMPNTFFNTTLSPGSQANPASTVSLLLSGCGEWHS